MTLRAILRSGYVRRFHANPDLAHVGDTVAHHHAMVAQIVFALHPAPSLVLIQAALHHDCGEMMVGDLPAPFKDAAPLIAAQHAAVEDEARIGMGLDWALDEDDQRWLRFADRLAVYVHVRQVAPLVLVGDGWPEARTMLDVLAADLGVAEAVSKLLAVDQPAAWDPLERVRAGSFAQIVAEVSDASGITIAEIKGYSRRADVVAARQRVMYLANRAGMSTPQIGNLLRRDHSTVMHGIDRETTRERDRAFGGVRG